MEKGKVSIITPVYNAEKFLTDTLESVLKQSYHNYELILVDDCSIDNSKAIIDSYAEKDKRIKYIKLKSNSGAAVARNTGLQVADGQYIAFIDSDDLWKEKKLETQVSFMKNNKIGFTYTNYEIITEDNEIYKKKMTLPKKLNYSGLLKNTAIACSSVIIDRSIIGNFKMPEVRKGQDTATWLKILKHYSYAVLVDEVLGSYRLVQNSISSNKLGALQRTWNTYRNIEKLNLPKSLYYFSHYTFNAIVRRFFS